LLIADWHPQRVSVGKTLWDKPNSTDYLRKFSYKGNIRIESHDLDGMEIMLQCNQPEPAIVSGTIQIDDGAKLRLNAQIVLYSTDKEQS
jgi:hypothetical protein